MGILKIPDILLRDTNVKLKVIYIIYELDKFGYIDDNNSLQYKFVHEM